MSYIRIKDKITGAEEIIHTSGDLDDTKARGAAIQEARGFNIVSVFVSAGIGRNVYKAVPRTKNTGPGRVLWERA